MKSRRALALEVASLFQSLIQNVAQVVTSGNSVELGRTHAPELGRTRLKLPELDGNGLNSVKLSSTLLALEVAQSFGFWCQPDNKPETELGQELNFVEIQSRGR